MKSRSGKLLLRCAGWVAWALGPAGPFLTLQVEEQIVSWDAWKVGSDGHLTTWGL